MVRLIRNFLAGHKFIRIHDSASMRRSPAGLEPRPAGGYPRSLSHAVGALFPGDLLARNLAQQGVPLNGEQYGDAQRMQAGAE
jgi:hypothetical protein